MSHRTARAVIPIILSGGSGTRLWPLSRELRPKQFLPLVGDRSLFQETVRRVQGLDCDVRAPIVVCNSAHRYLVAEQLRELAVTPGAIVLEPAGRNTAPAVAVAALLARGAANDRTGADPLLLVLPADHVILDVDAFGAAVNAGIDAAVAGRLVTFGVVPDKPETGYGYVLRGKDHGPWSVLEKFVEKPNLATATAYVASGKYFWNSGMFLFEASAYLSELAKHEPRMAEACERAARGASVETDFTRLGDAFLESPSNSIDYAVMEKTANAAVVSLSAGWSDVGSWPALHDVLPKDSRGNTVVGDTLLESCRNSYVAATSRLVAAIGLDGVIVVETDDAVLVMTRDHAQDVKKIVDALKGQQRAEAVGVAKAKTPR